MSNEPNKPANAPANNSANQATKTTHEAKPEVAVTPTPAVAPVETKKS
jgi:hypothetical protein